MIMPLLRELGAESSPYWLSTKAEDFCLEGSRFRLRRCGLLVFQGFGRKKRQYPDLCDLVPAPKA
jgi:hypothetical protein